MIFIIQKVSFYTYSKLFNFSAINNYAVKNYAKGEHILLLNNDTKIISDEWLLSMLEYSQQNEIGAVGGLLLYGSNTIQHAGIIVNDKGICNSSFFNHDGSIYKLKHHVINNYQAVTGACLMVEKELYNKIGGLDKENLAVDYNDVDFCLRLIEQGYRNVFTPYAKLYHYESASRDASNYKSPRFIKESDYMLRRHKKALSSPDPYYNINLIPPTRISSFDF